MRIKRTIGEHIGLPGDRIDYYPQAEAEGGEFNIVVLPANDADATAWTGETAAQEADRCERRLRMMLSATDLFTAALHAESCLKVMAATSRQPLSPAEEGALRMLRGALAKARGEGMDAEDGDEGEEILALDAEDAAEEWAETDDRESADYTIVGGDPATVEVEDSDGRITRFEVRGEISHTYYATEIKESK